ncbi:MAG: excinuclease ABC subunit UvrB [Planctomycetes bacterium]|nr:excinuclease ABC subunit UvrB [Planctomycetota bacterium]MBT6453706.1 excinuclease ABC subunit UvrB [Planctomycetota bacterium]MBT6540101.1 excinuclease ABC subunit UvrB [Planctomycetota bacterium]MBT7104210.1 excinuclease ABC subunit UvrB [Planctomycetota bacterium]MBT7130592.1 excinuclease ABC subunit UvrB [Planctomycetota bacterium]
MYQYPGSPFVVHSEFAPAGDQPAAIDAMVEGLDEGKPDQVLLGVTGSGKTYMMAQVIARTGRPAIIISHNKTLAAQLYSEMKKFLPQNAVEYFVSYYDYYQPEAYLPARDMYIEKDAGINADLDRLRLATTASLLTRPDVVIVSSVSCIYGLGSPEAFKGKMITLAVEDEIDRDEVLRKLIDIQYQRNDIDPGRASFRARGDVLEVHAANEEVAYRIDMFGDSIERIEEFHPVSGVVLGQLNQVTIFPAKHYVVSHQDVDQAIAGIQTELHQRLIQLREQGKELEAHRLQTRTRYDLELLSEAGYCPGIENYARHLNGFEPGERPPNLLDYFPDGFLTLVDESHVTLPQLGGMYEGDRSRKQTLVDHGFRLPSALDNRPMKFPEWEKVRGQTIHVTATPAPRELEKCGGEVIEVINRPTGLLDPEVEVRPARGQVQDLLERIQETLALGDRVLVTTLTKRMSEDLSDFFQETQIKARYLHSEIDTLERVEILQQLRRGTYDVLVGVNLLREGLDLPEVSLVAVMDADKEGFLRSATALIQTIGRAARNERARVILYGDVITGSMERAIDETNRRRTIQQQFNDEHGIVPKTIRKELGTTVEEEVRARTEQVEETGTDLPDQQRAEMIDQLEQQMLEAAQALDFERAAALRDRVRRLRGEEPDSVLPGEPPSRKGRKR